MFSIKWFDHRFTIEWLLPLFLLLVAGPAMAQPTEEWVTRYNGPGDGADIANALAVDAAGNVYVTGYSAGSGTDYDYATIKYDHNGIALWAPRYNGPGDGVDRAYAVAADDAGNVYVTGRSYDSGSGDDYATVKYDAGGNQIWVARYDGPGNSHDAAYALAVDNAGNVYVTGYSTGSGTGWDWATVKYSPDGNQLWVVRYNGPGNDSDAAKALVVDADGYVYVTGYSHDSSTYFDYATAKYDPNGNQLWVARYNGPGDNSDVAYALAVDDAGKVYVTGHSMGSGTGYDYATVKYDPNGNQLWVARYNGPGDDQDVANALAVDADDNVYVTGYSYGSGTDYDYATVKHDPNGNQVWVARYDGPASGTDATYALAVDADGNVYVTGYSYGSGSSEDYATVKYDSSGNQLWVARYNGPGNSSDEARALWVDASDNIYVTGYSYGSGSIQDYATIKYNQDSGIAEQIVGGGTPLRFDLLQNYPNPFNAATVIEYQLPVGGYVTLAVYNVRGQREATLVQGMQEAGYRSVTWDASGVSSGLYFYRLSVGDYAMTKGMLLLK